MPMTLEQIEHEVELLPPDQIEDLLDFIGQHRRLSEHDRAWGEESVKRYEAYKAGKIKAYSLDEVMQIINED